MFNIKISPEDFVSFHPELNTKKTNYSVGIPPIDLKICASKFSLRFCKLFRLYHSASTFSFCQKHILIQLLLKNRGSALSLACSHLTSDLPKVFNFILYRKIWKHLESSILNSDHYYGFPLESSTGCHFSSSLSLSSLPFCITVNLFAEAQDVLKILHRVWYKAKILNFPLQISSPSICNFSYSLSGCSISSAVNSCY